MTSSPLDEGLLGAGAPMFAARYAKDGTRVARALATHTYAALSFYTEGSLRFEQRGRWMLEAGDVLLVPAGEPHRFLEARRAEFWSVGFCVPCFAAGEAVGFVEPFERVREGASVVVRIPSARHAFLEGLFRELSETSAPSRRGETPAVQRSLLTLVLNEVRRAARWDVEGSVRANGAAGTVGAMGTKGVVAESLTFIERNCLRPLTLKDVAKAVCRSPAYVTTALTRATGRSAVEWIIAGRMAEARRLLLHSDERVDGIAERVGYVDPTHFIRMFRRAHGTTPSAWRAAKSLER
ncbi:AraC family transcriptional regulator [Pendulispora albinea]|uniref:AraC family transcriptional regulator n=1 Tax=Pendulispora albinea TaxID=2741071 RepID=A0ABZ2M6L0_9BACT